MDMSTQLPMAAGYFIYRSGEQSDPTALEFCPPKGSDELFFALKAAYPLVKTHSDRMRNAVIEFLKQELTEEQNQITAPVIPVESSIGYEAVSDMSWSSWPSVASNSTLSSPDLLNLATPASMSSSYTPTMSRQNSTIQSQSAQKSKPGLEEMTGVFSLSSDSQPKTRVRRKMTETEKVEYRKRRIVKACESCSKRKRKCNHNQPEMEKVRSSKVTKNKAFSSNVNSARVEQIEKALFQPAEPSGFVEDPFMFLNQNMFSELPVTDPLMFNEDELDSLFAPKVAQTSEHVSSSVWPWSDTPDWTLIDTPLPAHVSPSSPTYSQALFPQPNGLLSPQPTPQLELIHDTAEQTSSSEVSRTERQTPTRTWRNFSDFSRTAFSTADGLDGKEMPLVKSASMGLSSPGDLASSTQSLNRTSTTATLSGNVPSSPLMASTSKQFFEATERPQPSRLVTSQTHGAVNASGLYASQPQVPGGSSGCSGDSVIGIGLNAITPQMTRGQADSRLSHVQQGLSPRIIEFVERPEYSISIEDAGSNARKEQANPSIVLHANIVIAASRISLEVTASGQRVEPHRVRHASTGVVEGLTIGQPSAEHSSLAVTAANQTSAASVETNHRRLVDASLHQATPARSGSRAFAGELPSAARPSSLSADSTSTSSSSSPSRAALPNPRHPTANLSVLDHARSGETANAPLQTSRNESTQETLTPQSKLCLDKMVETPQHHDHYDDRRDDRRDERYEASLLAPLKSDLRSSHGRITLGAASPSSMDANCVIASPSTPEQPARNKRPHGLQRASAMSSVSPATLSQPMLPAGITQIAFAVFIARLCITWRTVAAALAQTTTALALPCRGSGHVVMDMPRAMVMA